MWEKTPIFPVYSDMEMAREEQWEINSRKCHDNMEWTKYDGTKIKVKDMSIDHIINSLNMLERSDKSDSRWIHVFKDELKYRGIKLKTQEKLITMYSVI